MRPPDRLARVIACWHGDLVVAVSLIAVLLAALATEGQLRGADNLLEAGCAAGVCACVVLRRAQPQLAAVAAAAFLAGVGLTGSTADVRSTAALPGSLILVPIAILAYSLGADARFRSSLLALLLLAAGVQLLAVREINPFHVLITAGPWAVGLVARSRRRHTEQLVLTGQELAAERELFAAESVRYERARIARELHDIVAHCVTVMVVQASAGQRLAVTEPALAAEAFDSIAETARQAETEIGRLVELLSNDPWPRAADGIDLIGELIARAGATGLVVTCRFAGSTESLPDAVREIAYRVVQESLTNAFRHAPGAPVDVIITTDARLLEISVVNGSPASPRSALAGAGAGRGLAGMRERVAGFGGEVAAGPSGNGGWQVLASLPVAARVS